MNQKIITVSGTRKKAIARATAREGTGAIIINKQPVDMIGPEISRLRLQEPVTLAGDHAKKVDIDIQVAGGGSQSQIEASRLAIAKAIYEFSNKNALLKKTFIDYDRHLMVADSRKNEAHKPNDSKPRAKRQKSYR